MPIRRRASRDAQHWKVFPWHPQASIATPSPGLRDVIAVNDRPSLSPNGQVNHQQETRRLVPNLRLEKDLPVANDAAFLPHRLRRNAKGSLTGGFSRKRTWAVRMSSSVQTSLRQVPRDALCESGIRSDAAFASFNEGAVSRPASNKVATTIRSWPHSIRTF